ncbi:hypothetical protein SAMN04490178_11089 [Propionispora vibrioides]|uniref:Uncharacterized protein n=1 Tax=Propionispora vibrioides TaxID=112903 RepID=A0A1H8V5Q3_9FIRM|nr:hypothetical protein SAMN04490178_11089 [Propionispora vibrioides]
MASCRIVTSYQYQSNFGNHFEVFFQISFVDQEMFVSNAVKITLLIRLILQKWNFLIYKLNLNKEKNVF